MLQRGVLFLVGNEPVECQKMQQQIFCVSILRQQNIWESLWDDRTKAKMGKGPETLLTWKMQDFGLRSLLPMYSWGFGAPAFLAPILPPNG